MKRSLRHALPLLILLLALLPLQVASAAVLEVIENTFYDASVSAGLVGGQSFTVSHNGYITQVGFVVIGPSAATLRLYEGAGNGGTLLHSQPVIWPGSTSLAMINLSSPVPVTAGQVYTAYHGTTFNSYSTTDVYPGGIFWGESMPDATRDSAFRIVIDDGRPADPNATDPIAEPFFQFARPALSVEAFNNRNHPHNGTLPLDVFEPHWWGVKILTPANFPALKGIDLSTVEVRCLDERGRWTSDYVRPWAPPTATRLQVWITQHGLCGIFPTG